jgi:hypothetical protein
MAYFDEKQIKLINSWHKLSLISEDSYMAFMSEWITLNAICYNLYHEIALIERANIDRAKSKLKKIHQRFTSDANFEVQNARLVGTSEKWSIDLSLPERLYISISNNYTEDIIFNEFVRKNQDWYEKNSTGLFEELKMSLKKDSRYYVINMAKSKMYNPENDINEMINKNIIILCENNDLQTIKSILYQIRCNIFHGEKTPGDFNDDRIVKTALPVLRYIVNYQLELHNIKTNNF